jgi:hypothetical protein
MRRRFLTGLPDHRFQCPAHFSRNPKVVAEGQRQQAGGMEGVGEHRVEQAARPCGRWRVPMWFPWNCCQREMMTNLVGLPLATAYWRARRAESSTASEPVQENQVRQLSFIVPGAWWLMMCPRLSIGSLVKTWGAAKATFFPCSYIASTIDRIPWPRLATTDVPDEASM